MHLTVDIYYSDAGKWQENKHPRGQPKNKGEFVKKGQGGVGAPKSKPAIKPPEVKEHYVWREAPPDVITKPDKPSASWVALRGRWNTAFAGKGAAESFMPSYSRKTWATVDPRIVEALKEYTGAGAEKVNTSLRDPTQKMPRSMARLEKTIDKAFDLPIAKLKNDFVLYRGINLPPGEIEKMIASLKKGAPVQLHHPNYVSTSLLQGVGGFIGDVQLEVLVPKEIPALALQKISSNPWEEEVLLPRGQNFQVLEIKQKFRANTSGKSNFTIYCAAV